MRHLRPVTLLCRLVILTGLFFCLACPQAAQAQASPTPLFYDDFTKDTAVNPALWNEAWPRSWNTVTWKYNDGTTRATDTVPCVYAADALLLKADGLHMVFTKKADGSYQSAVLTTWQKFAFAVGSSVTIKMKFATGAGVYCAAWSKDASGKWPAGEIDFETFGCLPGSHLAAMHQTIHYDDANDQSVTCVFDKATPFDTSIQTYRFDWQASGVTFYLDGVKTNFVPAKTALDNTKQEYLLLSITPTGAIDPATTSAEMVVQSVEVDALPQ